MPRFLQRKLREAYLQLSAKDGELVERGLPVLPRLPAQPPVCRHALTGGGCAVARVHPAHAGLPTVVRPRAGPLFAPHPGRSPGRKSMHNDGSRRAGLACKEESIDPKAPSRLPLLFALDTKFAIPNGFHYVPDCRLTGAQSSSAANSSSGGCGGDLLRHRFFGWQPAAARATLAEPTASDGSGGDGGGDGGGCGGAAIEPHKPKPHQATMAAQRRGSNAIKSIATSAFQTKALAADFIQSRPGDERRSGRPRCQAMNTDINALTFSPSAPPRRWPIWF